MHGDHKNPEYRIADDIRLATDSPVDFAAGVTTAVTVLWTIGGSLSFSVAGIEITIPGFLVVAAVVYAVLASGSMVFIGHRFVTVWVKNRKARPEQFLSAMSSKADLTLALRQVGLPAQQQPPSTVANIPTSPVRFSITAIRVSPTSTTIVR